jgi:hypothetical protein
VLVNEKCELLLKLPKLDKSTSAGAFPGQKHALAGFVKI